MKDYPFIDCTEKYDSIMVFGKNKDVLVHRKTFSRNYPLLLSVQWSLSVGVELLR